LAHQHSALFIDDPQAFPSELQPDKVRIALLGAQLFVAINGQNRLLGWFALGPGNSGEAYTAQELNYLTEMSAQAAAVLERAQIVADKDRRVREMNVLSRVAQGVNITLEFDDILELIYAQTNQVIPFDDFAITMLDAGRNTLTHTFYVESHERLQEREGAIRSQDEGLEQIVINSKQPIITDDYARECRDRGVLPARDGLFAWVGVPLNAGAETIGLISLGSRNSSNIYTQDQYAILQAIADQAAGAIVKARLLNESDQRARQLATLNEVARSLTSTLEIEPLLNSILESAVGILNCEAGSLLLQDDDTGELVFEVVVGPVAEDLTGKRLQPGVGLVGKAVSTTAPVIVNNVETSAEWFQEPDKQTGFMTRGLLVVPMMVKQRVIGVIEVINKKDFTPFDEDDQELLMAFTGQAAIAFENARLYTQTDQKLASRVEELSVLQRVDRELNTSLDVKRAMQITLDWAMRQSETTAGLIGILQDSRLSIMASQGYAAELEPYQDDDIPLDLPALNEAVQGGQVYLTPVERLQNGSSLLTSAQSQLVIPISREADVIGVLLLESAAPNQYTDETQAFLIRLSDHASIAISNAQLYTAVQQANIAKSEFVSFVSHELKTPMTSIKGYADLLSAGSVGEITEAQSNFLSTIRTNVDRMSTLVSDLADISRIEAGRLKLEFAAVPVQEVVDEVVRSSRALVEQKEQSLSVEIPEDLPRMWGDRNRLIQVLANLLSNAVKYTPEGGHISIDARRTDQKHSSGSASELIQISVRDDGIGIKEEDQKNIFQQYYRTEEGKEAAPGTGLGLNITRYLVEMQGGEIWFESQFGRGTTFHITVPIAEIGTS
jgi:signal transduction histidine kinase